jgi:FtsP/CotA-like multicopper oxidase with cupredoxin domain
VEVGVGDTLNLTLDMMMAPQESAPYSGHTIHMHGADVITSEDGIPETGGVTTGDTYTWTPASGMEGAYAYHCHQHTVKHLEMGMYATLVVRPKNASGAFLNQINSDAATAFDYVQNYLFSTVDINYHSATGDSTVFADYNPTIFLINGKEGKTTSAPAITLAAAPSKKVSLRLIGMHSTNATFSLGGPSFLVYVRDGRTLSSPLNVTSVDITPGTRYDILFTLPSSSGTMYPQIVYKKLRDNATYATVYGKITY